MKLDYQITQIGAFRYWKLKDDKGWHIIFIIVFYLHWIIFTGNLSNKSTQELFCLCLSMNIKKRQNYCSIWFVWKASYVFVVSDKNLTRYLHNVTTISRACKNESYCPWRDGSTRASIKGCTMQLRVMRTYKCIILYSNCIEMCTAILCPAWWPSERTAPVVPRPWFPRYPIWRYFKTS